ncbi:MAG: peptide deformylase [Nitrospirota bacterium]
MAVLEIKKYPDKILMKKTELVREFDGELQRLIDNMIETMYTAPGIGLAANQVGVSKQVLTVDVRGIQEQGDLIVLINPEVVSSDGECEIEEGCLSLPEYKTVLKRPEKIRVTGLDRKGSPLEFECDGLLARALQHEIDHLNGILLIDRIGRIKKEFFKKRYKKTVESSK